MYYVSMSVVIDPNRNTVITVVHSIVDSETAEEIASMSVTSPLIEISKGRKGILSAPVYAHHSVITFVLFTDNDARRH